MCMAQATMLLWETMKEGRRTASRGHLTTVSLCLTPPMPMEKRSITLVCGWRDAGRREQVIILDKGCNPGQEGSADEMSQDLIRQQCEESRQRLQTDYVDYYILAPGRPGVPGGSGHGSAE